jgi:hypothetical protein
MQQLMRDPEVGIDELTFAVSLEPVQGSGL